VKLKINLRRFSLLIFTISYKRASKLSGLLLHQITIINKTHLIFNNKITISFVGELFDEQLINRMGKLHYIAFFILLVFKISSQNVQVNIITRQNDTIKEFRLKDYLFDHLMVLDRKKKLVVVNAKVKKENFTRVKSLVLLERINELIYCY
jgi:hypothetical protein